MNQFLFKPRILLIATALAAGAAGAQSTDTTPSATTTPETPSRMSYAPCANLQGVALSDCLQQNAGTPSTAHSSSPSTTYDSSASHPESASLPSKSPDRPASLSADSVGSGGDRMNYGTPNSAPTMGSTAALDRSASANTVTSSTYHGSTSASAPIIGSAGSRPNDSTQQSTSSSATNPTGAPPGTSAYPSDANRTSTYSNDGKSNDSTHWSASSSATDPTRAIERSGSSASSTTPPAVSTYSTPASGARRSSQNDSTQMSTSSSATNPTGANAETRATFRAMLGNCVQLSGTERDRCIDQAVDAYPQS